MRKIGNLSRCSHRLQIQSKYDSQMAQLPLIIQGGMGVAVSNFRLANAVSRTGNLGVVSGTGLDAVLSRRLQLGDPTGELQEAFAAFPVPEMARRVWDKYFRAEKEPGKPFISRPLPHIKPSAAWLELTVVANFVEVWLARKGHDNPVGINLLEKIQIPHLASLFGAMLAGVDFVLMGAGIPRQIPACLDSLSRLDSTDYRIDVAGAEPGEVFNHTFDPKSLADWGLAELKRPKFFAIVSSNVLATQLVKKLVPPVDGLVVEFPLAGGHNAPPRGALTLDENNEPIYGAKDEVDLAGIAALGVPFYLAGAYGHPEMLRAAVESGANGIQVGTAFAFCDESGVEESLKRDVVRQSLAGSLAVHTSAVASPTGFPFKVAQVKGTLSDVSVYQDRNRICDLGYLRTCYRTPDGGVGYRCAAEPVDDYIRKGGSAEDTENRMCVCNGLMGTVGLPQTRKDGSVEPTLITAGNDLAILRRYIPEGQDHYSAADVISMLKSGLTVNA